MTIAASPVFMLTDVYIFLHFCLHLHMCSVMLQINEYDDDDDDLCIQAQTT